MTAVLARIEALDQEGRGIAHVDGKVFFVEGALPGEVVELEAYRHKPSYALAVAKRVVRAAPTRVTPRCPSFGVCGGCSMQHLEPRAQVAVKQRVLEDNLARIGKVVPETMLGPIYGPFWGYRYRARFSSRYVRNRAVALVGFRERRHTYVADMPSCDVVPPRISALLLPLRELVSGLSIRERLPQIELAIGEDADVLVFRILQPLSEADEARLRAFADRHRVTVYLQPGGPDSARLFHPDAAPPLRYRLPDFDLEFPFRPTDFTQVNHEINRVLVRRAVALLDPRPGERIGDLFCGLGNFSLAIARRGAHVLGIEGNRALVERASGNAAHNGLQARCAFRALDLFEIAESEWQALGGFDKLLIDPPRDGAIALVKLLGSQGPRRVVYVSCNPATLARDAGVMVHVNGYRLVAAGVVNMFPHTSHVESIALFEREDGADSGETKGRHQAALCVSESGRYSRLPANASSRFSRCTNML
ncbi:MAG TPA: 23S rRNA (uracil(1939)-C(5))-methyltransferase RlmD [Burkholderiales bacterium]|nr:23S rRNA (uracil(1939)-C(5))-methyltransferase RlmD [Burkholderiales bacterium]